jgi:hypothetical protein
MLQRAMSTVLVCLTLAAARPALASGLPTRKQLLTHLRDRDARCATCISIAEWTELTSGSANGWAVTTIQEHQDGRIKVHSEPGTFGEDGRRIPAECRERTELYNGTITVRWDWHPDRDEVGNPLDAEALTKPHPGYHSALVWDGLFNDPHSTRTPWGIAQGHLTRSLAVISEGEGEYRIESLEPGTSRYQVTYRLPAATEDLLTYTAEVDGDRGWIVPRIEGRDAEGRILHEGTTQFRRTEGGVWVPTNAAFIVWGGGKTEGAHPVLEWRCTVQRFDVNPPDLDKSLTVVLAPNTSVYDVRHKIGYRMPKDGPAVNPDFDLYALEAKLADLQAEQERE